MLVSLKSEEAGYTIRSWLKTFCHAKTRILSWTRRFPLSPRTRKVSDDTSFYEAQLLSQQFLKKKKKKKTINHMLTKVMLQIIKCRNFIIDLARFMLLIYISHEVLLPLEKLKRTSSFFFIKDSDSINTSLLACSPYKSRRINTLSTKRIIWRGNRAISARDLTSAHRARQVSFFASQHSDAETYT